jgi:hypothetical protein
MLLRIHLNGTKLSLPDAKQNKTKIKQWVRKEIVYGFFVHRTIFHSIYFYGSSRSVHQTSPSLLRMRSERKIYTLFCDVSEMNSTVRAEYFFLVCLW